jgi:formiminotetrahydrofolate cyclodeaminase
MICSIGLNSPRLASSHADLRPIHAAAERQRQRLSELASADSAAFDRVMAAYRLPQGTASERSERAVAIQSALQEATVVPLEAAAACAAVIRLVGQAIDKVSASVLGDGSAALLLADAGLRGAQINVTLNLAHIRDSEFVAARQADLAAIVAGIDHEKERILTYVLHRSGAMTVPPNDTQPL